MKNVPTMNQNDWVKSPQPSYDAYSFDIKPSHTNPIYDIDVDELGDRGERPHPIPKYAGLSGYGTDAKRKIAWYISKIKGAKSEKEKKFYITKLNAFKKSIRPRARPKPAGSSKEKIIGGILLFGLGYVVLDQILG